MMLRNQSAHQDPFVVSRELFPQHVEYLQTRAIPLAVAKANGLVSVSSSEGAQLLGWKSLPSGGLAIPYRWRKGEELPYCRLRLDQPLRREDKEVRHVAPSKEVAGGVRPYVPPSLPSSALRDPTWPVVLVEAPPKALALLGLGGDLVPIGLGGVRAGGHDKEALDQRGERLPHPEVLELLGPLEGRTVLLLFDADRLTNLAVYQAEKFTAQCYANAGAKVLVAALPLTDDGQKQGPDDFLAAKGADALRKLLDDARPAGEVHHPYQEIALTLARTAKGQVLGGLSNALLVLDLDPRWEGVLAYDQFGLQILAQKPPPWGRTCAPKDLGPGPWSDEDDTRLCAWLETTWGVRLSEAQAAGVARVVAHKTPCHPVRDWLRGLQWDGTPRLDSWLSVCFGVADTPYTRAVGAKWLLSAVARVMRPGCLVKYMLILEGPQDLGKSTALRALFGDDWFTDQISDFTRRDASHDLWGKWCVELGELDVLGRQEASTAKLFISRQVDHFAPRYGRRSKDYPRQAVFVGTVNEGVYLKDATGNVRFWPVRCTRADVGAVRARREQLFAEAVARFDAGEAWHLEDRDVLDAAREEQEARYQGDAWEEPIASYVDGKDSVSIAEVLGGCFGRRTEDMDQREQNRVAKALGRLGWERYNKRLGKDARGRQLWEKRYRPQATTPTTHRPHEISFSGEAVASVVGVVGINLRSNKE